MSRKNTANRCCQCQPSSWCVAVSSCYRWVMPPMTWGDEQAASASDLQHVSTKRWGWTSITTSDHQLSWFSPVHQGFDLIHTRMMPHHTCASTSASHLLHAADKGFQRSSMFPQKPEKSGRMHCWTAHDVVQHLQPETQHWQIYGTVIVSKTLVNV